MPLVSVIIPTYNRARVIHRAISSVLAQTFKDYEVLVVDDGSRDTTAHVLDEFGRSVICLSQENRGVAAARNTGIRHAGGELLAFLDSDDEWLPLKLEKQVNLFGPEGPFFVCHTDEIWMREGKEVGQKREHAKQGGWFFRRALERCLISPSSVMISRHLLDRVGPFDERLAAAEDYDLWLRITAFWPVCFIPERLVVKHGGHEDQLSRTVPAIDRFRIQAIVKILENSELRPEYRSAAIAELSRKCSIVAAGCRKRGKALEAEKYLDLARSHQMDRP